MQKLTTHYHSLLRLPLTWSVDAVNFSADSKRIEIYARFIGGAVVCPVCGLAGLSVWRSSFSLARLLHFLEECR